MRIIVIGESWISIASRMKEEGHDVFHHTLHPTTKGDGMVQKTKFPFSFFKSSGELHLFNLERFLKKFSPDLIVMGEVEKRGVLSNFFRNKGIACFGGGLVEDAIKERPSYAKQLWKRLKLEQGEVMGVWNGEKFIYLFEWLEENTHIGRNSGVPVGAGGVGKCINQSNLLEKFIPLLKKMSYRGCIGVRKGEINFDFPLSFLEIYLGNCSSFFHRLATIQHPQGRVLEEQFFIQNLLSLPPFPYGENVNLEMCKDVPLPFQPASAKHVWWDDVYTHKGKLYCAGNTGRLGLVTARGQMVKEAAKRLYRTITFNLLPTLQFRTDLGLRASRHFQNDFPQLGHVKAVVGEVREVKVSPTLPSKPLPTSEQPHTA